MLGATAEESGYINVGLEWEETRERTMEELSAEEILQLHELERAETEVYAFGLLATTLGVDPAAPRAWAAVNGALIRLGIEPSSAQLWLPACNYDITCFAMTMTAEIMRAHAAAMAYLLLADALGVSPPEVVAVEGALADHLISLEEAQNWFLACNYDLPCFGTTLRQRLGLDGLTAEQALALRQMQEADLRQQIQILLVAGLGLPPESTTGAVNAELGRRGITAGEADDWAVSCDYDVTCFRQTMNEELYAARQGTKEGRTKLGALAVVLALALGAVAWRRRR
jgi:hypothetical protein